MAGRGPLPSPNARRTNAPTIPTTNLPASGRKGRAPALPSWVKLGAAGKAFWAWAWKTPQACAWGVGVGQEPVVARRAALEDILARSEDAPLPLMKEMRELDDRLGLTPKGLEALRWKIVADPEPEAAAPSAPTPGVTRINSRRDRLTKASGA